LVRRYNDDGDGDGSDDDDYDGGGYDVPRETR
jgi:hypothetical protein